MSVFNASPTTELSFNGIIISRSCLNIQACFIILFITMSIQSCLFTAPQKFIVTREELIEAIRSLLSTDKRQLPQVSPVASSYLAASNGSLLLLMPRRTQSTIEEQYDPYTWTADFLPRTFLLLGAYFPHEIGTYRRTQQRAMQSYTHNIRCNFFRIQIR